MFKKMKLQFWYSPASDYLGQKQGVIKLAVTLEEKESQFSTSIKVLKKDWQSRGTLVLPTDPNHEEKNRELNAILNTTQELAKRLRQKEIEHDVSTIILILNHLKQKTGTTSRSALFEELKDKDIEFVFQKKENENKLSFLKALDNLLIYKKRLTKGTKEGYRVKRVKVVEYFNFLKIPDLPAEEFTEEFALNMADWMEIEMKTTTIKKYMMHYASALKHAKRRGLIKANPLADFDYSAPTTHNYTHLTNAELFQLQVLPNLSKSMQRVRDAFRFMCYTSLHYIDYHELSKNDIETRDGSVWLIKKREKSGIEYCQKMHPFAIQIISQYNNVENLPRFKYATFHKAVIRLSQKAGINKNVTPKTGRKTFAYLCLNIWGYSLETTAKMMGLNRFETISYYGKVGRERVEKEVRWDSM